MIRKVNRLILGAVMLFLSFATPVYAIEKPDVSAKSAALYCAETGVFLYEKNINDRLPPASTTKIMSALLACESGRLAESVRVTKEMTAEGSSMGLHPGDRVTVRGLIYGMLLTSGNDAANAAAIVLGGSEDAFVRKMNERADVLGLADTHFANPSGLPDENHYSSARDLAILTAEALKNELFSGICAQENAAVYYGNPPCRRVLTNHNKLLSSYDGCIGVKTGFTKAAGRCLVSAAKREGVTLICVTLNDADDWADHEALLDHGFDRVKSKTIAPDASGIAIPVAGGGGSCIAVECVGCAWVPTDCGGLRVEYYLPPFVYAPVKRGDIVGTAVIYNINYELARLPLIAARDAEVRQPDKSPERSVKKNLFERIVERIRSWKKK